jgi:hypothetical protein
MPTHTLGEEDTDVPWSQPLQTFRVKHSPGKLTEDRFPFFIHISLSAHLFSPIVSQELWFLTGIQTKT